jgi:hypothetical protein
MTMRNLGLVLLIIGIAAFFYCSSQLAKAEPLPEGLTAFETLKYPGGKLELGRYLGAAAGFLGVLLIMFPGGR